MRTPAETRYARSGEVHIAYQTVGGGSVDVLLLSPSRELCFTTHPRGAGPPYPLSAIPR